MLAVRNKRRGEDERDIFFADSAWRRKWLVLFPHLDDARGDENKRLSPRHDKDEFNPRETIETLRKWLGRIKESEWARLMNRSFFCHFLLSCKKGIFFTIEIDPFSFQRVCVYIGTFEWNLNICIHVFDRIETNASKTIRLFIENVVTWRRWIVDRREFYRRGNADQWPHFAVKVLERVCG